MKQTIEKFYTSFVNLDAEGMVSCYHPDVEFQDPAFGQLKGESAKNMWRMLISSQKGKEFLVSYSNVSDNSANWEAHYTFSKTNRKVHNQISATFEFKDGLIIKHHDDFNLHKWAKQAMGFSGLLLGKTGFFKKKLQTTTNSLLKKFENKTS